MNPLLSNRIRFFNLLAMLLLVVIHSFNIQGGTMNAATIMQVPANFTNITEYFLANGLFRFRIPLLMMISGYLLAYKFDGNILLLYKKKAKSLLIPYILVNTLTLMYVAIIEFIWFKNQVTGFWGEHKVWEYNWFEWFYRLVLSPIPFQLWYLRVLFIFILLYPALSFLLKKWPIYLLTILLVWRLTFTGSHFSLLIYFTTGIYFFQQSTNLIKKPRNISLLLAAFVVFISISLKTLIAFHILHFHPVLEKYSLQVLQTIHAIFTCYVVWFSCDVLIEKLKDKTWYKAAVSASFVIYAFHEPLTIKLIPMGLDLFSSFPLPELWAFLTLPIFVVLVCMILDKLVFKAFPNFYSLLTGKRGLKKLPSEKTNASPILVAN
ncbi:MAG: acyltransferase family protein, partial [Chitinophagaceae bacterium]